MLPNVCPHLFTAHEITHALRRGLSDLFMLLKHIVLNLWKGLLLQDFHPDRRMNVEMVVSRKVQDRVCENV